MAQNPIIARAQLSTSNASVYACPIGKRAYVTKVVIVNTGGTDRTYSAYIVPNQGAPSAGNCIIYQRTVGASHPLNVDDARELAGWILESGAALYAGASGAGLTITIQAIEVD